MDMNENKASILTAGDLLNATPMGRLESLLRTSATKKLGEKPFAEITKLLEEKSKANAPKSTPSPTPTPTASVETPTPTISFDEGVSRLRMMLGVLPANQRQKALPVLIERMAKRLNPEDVEDFRTIGYGLLEEEDTKKDALEKYLPILLILSMMRSG
jgi:hypothetical protein